MKKNIVIFSAIIFAFIAGSLGFASAQANSHEERTASAIVRLGPNWGLHVNSRHVAVNIDNVTVNSDGDLEIRRNDLSGDWGVMTCITDEDETMVRLGVDAGCSGGGNLSVIKMYKDGVHVRADDPMFGQFANIWWSSIVQVP